MADKEKREEDKNTKIRYLENEKRFLDEIKTLFTVFEGLLFGKKCKFDKK